MERIPGAPDLQLGDSLGPYRLDSVLGEGAVGVVFAATRREDGQTVAEYSVILGVITPAIILVLSLLSGKVAGFFTSFASIIP